MQAIWSCAPELAIFKVLIDALNIRHIRAEIDMTKATTMAAQLVEREVFRVAISTITP